MSAAHARLRAALAVAAVFAAIPAHAVETPRAGRADARIKSIAYDPAQVVRVVGAFRTATQILFAPDETIVHVALGDSSAWDVAPEANVLFLKPKVRRGLTNLIVTTTRKGLDGAAADRHYAFELATRAGSDAGRGAATYFQLRFHYPDDDRARTVAALSAAELAIRKAVMQFQLERGALEGPRNLAYLVQGSPTLAPSEISDNGRFTLLRFAAAQAIPALYTVAPDGTESLSPVDVRGEFVVLHDVARQIRLRRGGEVVCLWNQAFSPYGAAAVAHTAASGVARTDIAGPPR